MDNNIALSILNELPEALFLVESGGVISYCNRAAESAIRDNAALFPHIILGNFVGASFLDFYADEVEKAHATTALNNSEVTTQKLMKDSICVKFTFSPAAMFEGKLVTCQVLTNEIALANKMTSLVEVVSASCMQMDMNSDFLMMFANETSEQAQAVKDDTCDVQIHVDSITNAISEMTCAINEITERTIDTATVSTKMKIQADGVAEALKQLSLACHHIGGITTVIKEIASETKYLALNATIEAGRVGSAGVGFAVVANEVRSLSHQSKDASDKIAEQVMDIQNASKLFDELMHEIEITAENINDANMTISSAIEEQSIVVNDIKMQSHNVLTKMNEVVDKLDSVLSNAQNSQSNTTEIYGSIKNLSSQSALLTDSVKGFLVDIGIL